MVSIGGDANIANLNPIRYRGYYYDAETGFLNSRYYDPEICRFINADDVVSSIGELVGYNLFSYCFNNPVNMIDSEGNWPEFIDMLAEDMLNFNLENTDEQKVLNSHFFSAYKGVYVLRTNSGRSGSLGIIALSHQTERYTPTKDTVRHEYGHIKQLEILGPTVYMSTIGIPSMLNLGDGDYYDKPWEVTADILGGVKTRTHSRDVVAKGFTYLATGATMRIAQKTLRTIARCFIK